MIKKPKKKVSKRTNKKVAKRKINKKSFRRNPENDFDEDDDELTPEQIKELQTLLLKKLNYLRKENSGENLNEIWLGIISFLRKEITDYPEAIHYILDAARNVTRDLEKIQDKYLAGEKVVIEEYRVKFD